MYANMRILAIKKYYMLVTCLLKLLFEAFARRWQFLPKNEFCLSVPLTLPNYPTDHYYTYWSSSIYSKLDS